MKITEVLNSVIAKVNSNTTHRGKTDNPHSVTKTQVGLSNVDNTADSVKNVLSATKWETARTITLNGDLTGSVSIDGSANVMLSAAVVANSVVLGTDTTGNYVAGNTAGTGIVVSGTAGEGWSPTITLSNVGTAGTYRSVTTDTQGRIIAGTNPTTASGYGLTDVYTKTEVDTNIGAAVSSLVDSSPSTLDTLNELAAALGDDPNFATTVTNNIGTKVTANTAIVAGTGTKVTYDTKGLVTSSTILSATDIPSLDVSKLTTGTLPVARGGTGVTTSTGTGEAVLSTSPVLTTPNIGTATGSVSGNSGTTTKLATARSIAASGDMTWTVSFDGSGNVTAAATLANSGITAGTYKSVTVDAKGRATAGTNPTTLAGYGITDAQTELVSGTNIKTINGASVLGSGDLSVAAATLVGLTSTVAELNKLEGYTGTATELNWVDTLHATGVTASEFDYLDGVTSAIQTQINAKSALSSPAFTGTPTAPTATGATNTTQLATTAQVHSAITADIGVANSAVVKTALNASGTAPIYACRAWVNFNGTGTVAIRASGNVSSITDNGTGDYTVNFTTAMTDVSYGMSGSKTYTTNYNVPATAGNDIMIGAKTISSQRIYVGGASGGANVMWSAGDVIELNLNFYR